ncbi:MAG: hypothetical protein HQL53_01080 [Magnetococcales bacterium]|nr:hypothetical protein [Magnetococcales bacterium]
MKPVVPLEFEYPYCMVLYWPHNHRFLVLNPAAAYIWNLLKAGLSTPVVIEAVQQDLPLEAAAIERIIDRFDVADEKPAFKNTVDYFVQHQQRPPQEPPLARWPLQLAGGGFTLSVYDQALVGVAEELFGHLRSGDETPSLGELHVWRDGAHYLMRSSCERIAYRLDTIPRLGPFLNATAMQLSFLTNPDVDIAFHASAVQRGKRLLLFFAQSGSGKSTLAAHFAHQGYKLLADDTLYFKMDPPHLLPVPTASSLKANSYFFGRAHHPGFDQLHEFIQDVGGKGPVKYIPSPHPGRHPIPLESLGDVTIIFPRYDADCTTAVRHLEPFEALSGMQVDGFAVQNSDLTRESVDFFLSLLTSGHVYALDFCNLEQAQALLERHFPEATPDDASSPI